MRVKAENRMVTDDNGIVDYKSNINAQLYELFGIDEKNQQHIRDVLATKE